MIFEKVNFNADEIRKMSRDEFESRHISILWQNRDVETRKKMLGQVYDIIHKPVGKPKKKSK